VLFSACWSHVHPGLSPKRSRRIAIGEQHHDYWDGFYAGAVSARVPDQPSAFARWVDDRLAPGHEVVELGFGTGRDSVFFARQGHSVRGYDFAESAVAHVRRQAEEQALTGRFDVLDLYDDAQVSRVAASLPPTAAPRAVYARFLVHSLEDAGRANLIRLSAAVLGGSGGELFLEFRTGKDLGHEHLFGDDHFRVFIDPATVEQEIEAAGGEVSHHEEGCGLAVYKTEDPHVARLVAHFPAAGAAEVRP
jgi:SAM-dependent methyltransferase